MDEHRCITKDVDGYCYDEVIKEGLKSTEPVLNVEELPWPPGSVGD